MPVPSVNAMRLKRLLLLLPFLVLAALIASWFWGSPPVKATLPSLSLETLDGEAYPLAPKPGTVRLVELIYTRCPDVCPTTTVKMVQLQKRLKEAGLMGHGVEFVTVTIDPANDTAEVLRKYARQLNVDPQGWTFLRGDEGKISEVTRSLGFLASKSEDGFISHTSSTYLVDPANAVIRKYGMGEDFDPEQIYQELLNMKQKGL